MILQLADILYQIWPRPKYLAYGEEIEAEIVDYEVRRVCRYVGPIIVALPNREVAERLVAYGRVASAMGGKPIVEITFSP